MLLLAVAPAEAKKKKKGAEPAPPPPKAKVVEKRQPAAQGLFNVQRHKGDWYLQIPDTLLDRPFVANTRYVSTPVDAEVYGGELANSHVLYWSLAGRKMLLRSKMYRAMADSADHISMAVAAADQDPILAAIELDTTAFAGMDSTVVDSLRKHLYSIKVTNLFTEENPAFGVSESNKSRMGLRGQRFGLSYIDTIMTFPINTEIITVKTFETKDNSPVASGKALGVATLKFRTSFVLLPEQPMRYRTYDPRVGYFARSFKEYSDAQQRVETRTVTARWRLEPRPEDVDRYRRGELVEPQKPIVYYIDPATPAQWRPYLIAGVNDWNKAFEAAGWKNAIRAEEWPNDSTMSIEDARFSVIRYLASPIANAYGPHVSDPRTGEILESHIGWYHNVMSLVHDWYMVQAGAVDDRAHAPKFDDELMGQLIRFVSSHEVGHTLGLRHNMGASSATPVEKLRDKQWLLEHGHTSSIMDYARFNYVAQPEDGIPMDGIFPRINDYDIWAIRWGYTYFPDAKTADEERLALNRMTIEAMKDRRLWFGGEGTTYDNDPRAQTEDLGDDAMLASDYGIRNLKRILRHLPEWTRQEADLGRDLESAYQSLVGQMRRYVGHVGSNIGGVYHDYKSVEQEGPVYTMVEKKRQQRALAWLDRNVFVEPHWLIAEPFIQRITDTPLRQITSLADLALGKTCSASVFVHLAAYSNAPATYQPADYVRDLTEVLFRETRTGSRLTPWRRYVQREAVNRLLRAEEVLGSDDAHAFVSMMLHDVQLRLQSASSADGATKAHYQDLARIIKHHFEKTSASVR